jgi:AbrB family looped-hinge helix DNA binding protein
LLSGQITIPAEFRQKLDIDEHTLLQIVLVGGELHIRPVKVTMQAAGSGWAKELYEMFAPVRAEASKHKPEEIDRDIEHAVAAVRKKRAASRD